MPQRPMSGSPSGTALSLHLRSSSNTSSLASPEDSGVTLESDMDICNETDSSYKDEDSSLFDASKYRGIKYGSIMGHGRDNKNLSHSLPSNDPSENIKMPIHSTSFYSNSQRRNITKSDLTNKNIIPIDVDDNELDCSNTAILEDNTVFIKSMDQQKLNGVNNQRENTRKDQMNHSNYYADCGYSFRKNTDLRSNSYLINNDTNLLELSMTISDCDYSVEAPYSILNTVNMSDASIFTPSDNDIVIQCRQRKKKRGQSKKRVSFHEDILKTMKLDDDENFSDSSSSFVSLNSAPKKETQLNRNSWYDRSETQNAERMVNEGRDFSNEYVSSLPHGVDEGDIDSSGLSGKLCDRPSFLERGVPEGQEDPCKNLKPKMRIELAVNEAQEAYVVERRYGYIVEDAQAKIQMPPPTSQSKCTNLSEWLDIGNRTTFVNFDERKNFARHLSSPMKKRNITAILPTNAPDDPRLLTTTSMPSALPSACRQIQPNTSLLSRFLRSITERKYRSYRSHKDTNFRKLSSLYIKGVKHVNHNLFKDFNDDLEKEIQENTVAEKCAFSGEKISSKLRETFKRHIYRDKMEELYKVYKVRSSYMINGESEAMLALLTDKTLYLTSSKTSNSYSNQFVIPYNELDVIIVGPNAQSILISNADHEMQYFFSTGSSQISSELIAHLEMAMRRSPAKPRLPAVKELKYGDMNNLQNSILSETALNIGGHIEHYSMIYIEEDYISPPSTPSGPMMEGDLMFRSHSYQQQSSYPDASTNPWEAGYFVLKDGIVYMFVDSSQQLPKRAFPLKGGLCQGCRRIPNSHRPHTFEILLKPNKSFQFAAPDEYVASEWLQSIVQSASGLFDSSEMKNPSPCSLIVTTKHLLTIKEIFPDSRTGRTLSCAVIEDLTAFRVPLAQQSWCILEFACREVVESSGDWVVYFTDHIELCAFREVLETLWTDMKTGAFPMVILSPDNKLHQRCSDTCNELKHAWENLLPMSLE